MAIAIWLISFSPVCLLVFEHGVLWGLPLYQRIFPSSRSRPRGWTLFEYEVKNPMLKAVLFKGASVEWTGPFSPLHQFVWAVMPITFFVAGAIVAANTPNSPLPVWSLLAAFFYAILAEGITEAIDYHLADAPCETNPYEKGQDSIIPPAIRRKRRIVVAAAYLIALLIAVFFLDDMLSFLMSVLDREWHTPFGPLSPDLLQLALIGVNIIIDVLSAGRICIEFYLALHSIRTI